MPRRDWPTEETDHLVVEPLDWSSIWEAPVIRTFEVTGVIELDCEGRGIVFFPNGSSTGGRIIVSDQDGIPISEYLVDPHTSELFTQ